MQKLTMPAAIVVSVLGLGVLAMLTILALNGVDSAPVVALLLGIAGAFGWLARNQGEQAADTRQVLTQSNGNNAALVEQIRQSHQAFIAHAAASEARMSELVGVMAHMVPLDMVSVSAAPPTSAPPLNAGHVQG